MPEPPWSRMARIDSRAGSTATSARATEPSGANLTCTAANSPVMPLPGRQRSNHIGSDGKRFDSRGWRGCRIRLEPATRATQHGAFRLHPAQPAPDGGQSRAAGLRARGSYQQIGATSGANVRQATSVTEFVDTATVARSRHTLKLGADLRREALDILSPPNPAGAYSFNAGATGNSVAALLLGHVNAFSIDLQPEALQPRARIAEFFATDEWNVSTRLTVNAGTRYTLNFPSTEKHDRGAIFNLRRQVLDFPHTARELES